nr:unnamed protein product [Digitaria exilis]
MNTTFPPALPCPSVSAVHADSSPDDDDTLLAACGVTAPPSRMAMLLKALPLLAIPFLPPPVAAVVALSTLATPVRACSVPSSDTFSGLNHGTPTCTVYRYHHGNATVDRGEPFEELRVACPPPHPRRDAAGSDERAPSTAYGHRHDEDPFHGYCSVLAVLAPKEKAWRIVPVHLPVADPAAVVAAGGDVCYVELEHMDYREGYYIRCPVSDCCHVPVICCTEFPHDAIAAAVRDREHHRRTYCDTVAWDWYINATARPELEGLEYNDELF